MISDVLHIMSESGLEGISARLRQRGADCWAAATGHAMVREIGAGTLPHATFLHYFEQNILYLQAYVKSIALILSKAPDLAATDVLSRFLGQIVRTEIPANLDFLRRLGGSPKSADDPAAMLPVTYSYARHLLSVCALEDCAAGLTAVLPCQWSYGELAGPLMAALPADEIYADWISMFGNASYDDLVRETTGLLNRLCTAGSAPDVDHLAAIFDRSTRYEMLFWDMAYRADAPGGATREIATREIATREME
jgi:thiaminase (transcriptional activator TenA)